LRAEVIQNASFIINRASRLHKFLHATAASFLPAKKLRDTLTQPATESLANMIHRAFFKAGHAPTLLAAFLYFDMSFMVWVMLGPLGVQIAEELHLDPAQKGLMVD